MCIHDPSYKLKQMMAALKAHHKTRDESRDFSISRTYSALLTTSGTNQLNAIISANRLKQLVECDDKLRTKDHVKTSRIHSAELLISDLSRGHPKKMMNSNLFREPKR
jgi:hypothetical protein